MRKQLPLLVLLFLPLLALAQAVTVPRNVYFADIHLRISDGAQREIQKKVDALHRSQTYFKIKVDLADAYFPIIERVFKEEGVPDDFKYLALQESGLIGDAVSTSNAVGYWQFKREAATDFNLRMDNVVDERRHIVEASRGAARYFKRSNNYYSNWFNTLLSYYHGYTGAKAYTKDSDKGSKRMDITEKSDPYLLTFLAHKVAYDNFVGKKPAVSLQEMRATPGQSLSDIALATKTDHAELEKYNKWLLGNRIPSDKDYYVLVPVRNGAHDSGLLVSKNTESPAPRLKQHAPAASMVKRNGLNALIARAGDTKDKLALQAGISTRRFLKYNDLHSFDEIVEGSAYYIEQKHTSAEVEYHVVQPGETMQMISQHHGIRLNYLRFKNRMSRNEVPVPGRVLWLQKRRPAYKPVEVRDLNQKQSVAATAAPSYSKPTATAVHTEDEATPRENIFTRFFKSLKGSKESEQASAQTPSPAPASKPVAQEEREATTAAGTSEKRVTAQESTTATTPKASPALYPAAQTAEQSKAGQEKPRVPSSGVAEAGTMGGSVTTAKPQPGTQKSVPPARQAAAEQKQQKAEELELTIDVTEEEEALEEFVVQERTTPKTTPATSTTAPVKQPAQQKPTRHTVKQGETLYSISRMYAVTVSDLVAWNNLGDAPLKLGQELLIAEPLTTPETEDETELPATLLSTSSAYHTVAAGETLYQISKKYNVSVNELRTWNSLPDNNLKLGQELRIKAPATTEAPAKAAEAAPVNSTGSTYHTVAGGESMYQISRKYGVTIKDIMEWNNKSDFSVSVGEKLLIKKR
ncbi:MAG: LysM peptidoglycan-binding domain-containing protein [Hymenobacteraceae bacterium]|nr:LysM peptidoglycan-binding domain-containing protein [Hymenobacteraceae bacterium]